MPTLSELNSLLGRYAGNGQSFTERLNRVRARIIQQDWPGTTQQITLTIHTDSAGNNIVTLPRQFISLRAGAVQNVSTICPGLPIPVSNPFSEFNANGLGYNANTNFQEVSGYFSVFQEWTSASKIRFKTEATEGAGTIYIYGTLNGAAVWHSNSGVLQNREAVALNGASAVTSAEKYDAYLFSVKKPATLGRISAYAVADDGTETLIAVYDAAETLPRWRRYKVPYCNPPTGFNYIGIAKLAYVPVVNDDDEVIPGNIGALQHGLDALLSEDSRDFATAKTLWDEAKALLVEQAENETGSNAEGVIEIRDDLNIYTLGNAL